VGLAGPYNISPVAGPGAEEQVSVGIVVEGMDLVSSMEAGARQYVVGAPLVISVGLHASAVAVVLLDAGQLAARIHIDFVFLHGPLAVECARVEVAILLAAARQLHFAAGD
jgi:hypothetical protein